MAKASRDPLPDCPWCGSPALEVVIDLEIGAHATTCACCARPSMIYRDGTAHRVEKARSAGVECWEGSGIHPNPL